MALCWARPKDFEKPTVANDEYRSKAIILRRRPFLVRLRNHYRAYRTIMMWSRWRSFRAAWFLATA